MTLEDDEECIPEWLEITRSTRFFTVDDVVALYWELVDLERDDGHEVDEAGVLNMSVIESAVDKMRYGDYFAPASMLDSVAFLVESVVLYHAFGNVNKRFASHAALVFLENNGVTVNLTPDAQDKLVCLLVGVAQGQIDRCGIYDFYARIVKKKRKKV